MSKVILIIEDNPDNMQLAEEILADAGYLTVPTTRAEDGIERLLKGGIDLTLMDISLPDMDGLEATRIIKSDNTLKSVPVIGLSAHAMTSDRQAALDAGCDDYQTKPIDEDALLESIQHILESYSE